MTFLTDEEVTDLCAPNNPQVYLPFGWGIAIFAENVKTLNTIQSALSAMNALTTSLIFMALDKH